MQSAYVRIKRLYIIIALVFTGLTGENKINVSPDQLRFSDQMTSAAVVARNSLAIQSYCDPKWKYNIALSLDRNDETGGVRETMIVLLNDSIGGCWSAE